MTKERKSTWPSLTTVSTLLLIGSSLAQASPVQAGNASLLWGTYRPNLYFGTRPRIPESLMTGLMWFDGTNVQGFQSK
jgi:mannosyl-oligosaccharide glucosidase